MRLTHIGTATVLIEVGGLRLLTDPALDPAGQRYRFGTGLSSMKTLAPAIPAGGLGRLDAVLVSHDQHADNLDDAGRRALGQAGVVLTTRAGARRLGGNARGLAPWESFTVARGGERIEITATPARHGPPLSVPLVGPVIGFVLRWNGQRAGAVYISGDTVWFGALQELPRRFQIGTALLHLGGARFPITGKVRYTLDARDAVKMVKVIDPRTIVPVHYDGWTHFLEPVTAVETALQAEGLGERVRRLPRGVGVELED